MIKFYWFIPAFLFVINNQISAQEYAADKGAFMVNGSASFSSAGGKIYEGSDKKRITSIVFAPSVDYFLKRNFFVGSAFIYSNTKNADGRENLVGIGPEVGYVIAKPETKVLPVVSIGYLFARKNMDDDYNPYGYGDNPYGYGGYGGYGGYDNPYGYTTDLSTTGNELFISAGIIIPVQKHIGITIGGIYRYQNFKSSQGDKASGNVIELCIGINGLLY